MPRMRTLKPDACTSETLAEVDRGIRWTFGTLWTHCDDEGRAINNLRLIKAAIYPLDDTVTLDVLAHDLTELERVGALCFYEIAGKSYLHVPSWDEHQHPNRKITSKLPPCPKSDHSPSTHAQRSEGSLSDSDEYGTESVAGQRFSDAVNTHAHSSEHAVSQHEQRSPVVVVVDVDGEGVGEGVGRANARRTELALVADRPITAQTIIGEWIDHSPKRPPGAVIGQISKLTAQMLSEGIDPDDIRRGLATWMHKRLHPATLPSVVHEVMNGPPSGRPPTRRTTDDKVRDGLDLARRLAAEHQPPDQRELP